MLLSDLGSHTLLSTLDVDQPHDAGNHARYNATLDELVRLQAVSADGLPPYDGALLQRELDLFPDWYFTQLRGQALDDKAREVLDRAFALIKAQVLAQPVVLVPRAHHPPN